MLKAGSLVQVRKACMRESSMFHKYNIRAVDGHGWLWFVVERDCDERDKYKCRSLMTGRHAFWYENELEIAPDAST